MKAKFHVGDRVRIRQWDDMEREFGVDEFGSIQCYGSFTEQMKPLCGYEFTVANIDNFNLTVFQVKASETESINAPATVRSELNDWAITFAMLEPAVEDEIDSLELEIFLQSIRDEVS